MSGGRREFIGARREKHQPSAVEPAGFVFLVGIAAQRAHAGAVVALECPGEFIADGGVARSLEIDKENRTAERGREEIGAFAGEVCHGAGPARGSEREEKLAFGLEGGEPCGERMRGAGADDDHVGGIERAARSVGMDDGDLGPRLERDAGTGRESLVDFDGDDVALRAVKLGEDRRVIAGAATEMKNVVAGMNVEQAQDERPRGWAGRC